MSEIKTYTQAGFKALQDELDYLVNVRVEENKKEISTARAFGDLSENSEYDEAKQEQGKIHARIDELREMIANAKVIDESQIDVLIDARKTQYAQIAQRRKNQRTTYGDFLFVKSLEILCRR